MEIGFFGVWDELKNLLKVMGKILGLGISGNLFIDNKVGKILWNNELNKKWVY